MKKRIVGLMLAGLMAMSMAACGGNATAQTKSEETTMTGAAITEAATQKTVPEATTAADSKATGEAAGYDEDITVISREDGSGTRGAFIELFGIEEKNDAGEKIDNTIDSADITNSTEVMLTSVSQNKAAIGYASLGSVNDSVKTLKIDGADATVENIKSGAYKIARPFNVVTKGEPTGLAKDFLDYVLSAEGQKVIEDNGYIAAVDNAPAYAGDLPSGKITIAGSSSVSPVMEKLVESYKAMNTEADIELQTSDSTTGVNSAADGVCDIGMASRELKESETAKGLVPVVIARDGIAVVVSVDNPVSELTKDQVKSVYVGDITNWSEIK